MIYPISPYGHRIGGGVSSLEYWTVGRWRAFYRQHYTQANLVLGVGVWYPAAGQANQRDFANSRKGSPSGALRKTALLRE